MNIRKYTEFYQRNGISFFPLPYREKAANLFWAEYQKRLPTDEEIKAWFTDTPSNIATVCGGISGNLVILDCDSEDKFAEISQVIERNTTTPVMDYTLLSETGKGYHIWLRTEEPVKSHKFPRLDIKAEGGYIVAPPSIHPEGKRYRFLNRCHIRTIKSLVEIGLDINSKDSTAQSENAPGWVSMALRGVGEGCRNDMAAKLAGYFRILPLDVAKSIMLNWNEKNTPPLDNNELIRTIEQIYRYPERKVNKPKPEFRGVPNVHP